MRVLIIDNNIDPNCWGASDLVRSVHESRPLTEVHVRRGPHGDLPRDPQAFDRIVVSGSKTSAMEEAPWITALDSFVDRALTRQVPLLGVCYGHQTLARVLGGCKLLRKAVRPELGWVKVKTLEQNTLFQGLPTEFHTIGSHYDEVSETPPGTRRIAESEHCSVQAFEVLGARAFGIQFHPEKNLEESLVFEKKVIKRGEGHLFLEKGRSEKVYSADVVKTIFRNFLG